MAHEKRDHFIFEVGDSPNTRSGKAVKATSPDQVLRIHDEEELKLQLEHYSHPLIRQTSPKSPFARKFYVEKVRPALRYYCKKFGVKIPKWLENEDYYTSLTDSEKMDLFGTTKIKPREFSRIKTFGPGEVVK